MAVGQHGRWWWGAGMLVAGRENVHFHGMPDRINPCLASEIGQSQFRIGRDEENGAILEGQRNTEVHLSATRSFECHFFSLEYPCHGDQFCLVLVVKKSLEQQGKLFPHAPKCME